MNRRIHGAASSSSIRSDGGWASEALSGAQRSVFWTDGVIRRARPAVDTRLDCDLAVVGGGFTGLWAALIAAERTPGRRVVVVEGDTLGFGASSRNGGFVDSSITHGLANG